MTDDERLTWGFILEVLDVLERHGYRRSDDQHTGQAIGLIRDVARIYEGTLDAPRGRLRRGAVIPADGTSAARPARPGRRHRLGRPRSRPCWPRWTTPPTTSGTGPRRAPTAPTSPAPPASGACRPPTPTTSWPAA